MSGKYRGGKKAFPVAIVFLTILSISVFGESFSVNTWANHKMGDANAYMEEALSKRGDVLIKQDVREHSFSTKKESGAQTILGQLETILIDPIEEGANNVLSQFSPSAIGLFKTMGGEEIVSTPRETLDWAVKYSDAMKNGTEQDVLNELTDKYGKQAITGGAKDLLIQVSDQIVPGVESVYESVSTFNDYMGNCINTLREKVKSADTEKVKNVSAHYLNETNKTGQSGDSQSAASGNTPAKTTASKSISSARMQEVRTKAETHAKSSEEKDPETEEEDAAPKSLSELDAKWLDVANWVGMDFDEVNSHFTKIDVPVGLKVFYDDNKRITEVDIEDPAFNVMGISPDSSYEAANAMLTRNGWIPDGDFVGVPWGFADEKRARGKNYNIYTDEEAGLCVESDCYAYIKDGYVIDLVIAYPEGQTWGAGSPDDHLFSIVYAYNN